MSGKLKKLLSLALVCLMVLAVVSPQLAVSAAGNGDSSVTQTGKSTKNKPTKTLTDEDVKDMAIRIYAVGTEVVNDNNEFFSTMFASGTMMSIMKSAKCMATMSTGTV